MSYSKKVIEHTILCFPKQYFMLLLQTPDTNQTSINTNQNFFFKLRQLFCNWNPLLNTITRNDIS